MIHNERMETMPRADLEQLQIERLQSTVNRACRNVAFYRHRFAEHAVEPDAVRRLDALRTLPFTTKADLRASYPYDMFAVPLRDIVRIHSSSGTTGKPIGIGYTRNDLAAWTELVARVMTAAGVTDHDCVQVAFAYSLFTGAFGFHQGAERIGASVIPASNEEVHRQIEIMRDFKSTALACTPSHALHLARALEAMGLHPESLDLERGLFGAEPWSEALRERLERDLGIRCYDNYGISELMGPGVAGECTAQNGLHINEDHFIVEVVDPATGEPLAEGETGELVFTTIAKEGFPLLRYRTGDISSVVFAPCACGRTFARMQRVTGRSDDCIALQERHFFPSQVEAILLGIEGIEHAFRIVLEREEECDVMRLEVAILPTFRFDEVRRLENLQAEIRLQVETKLGVPVRVRFVQPASLRSTGPKQAARVVDRRGAP